VQRLCLARRTLPHVCRCCARDAFLHSFTSDQIMPDARSAA
jgi:hypothetical protein